MEKLDALYFSRGRGRGHAVPDLAIICELRKSHPELSITFVSYGTGAEVLSAAGESVINLGLPDTVSFVDLLLPFGELLRTQHPLVVISHEEPAVLPLAKIFGLATIFLIHWFTTDQDPTMQALVHADEILFMEKEGIFPEPESVKGRVRYLGPVLRRFEYRPEDRENVRAKMGFHPEDKVLLMVHGSPREKAEPAHDLVLEAFKQLDCPRKHLIWVAGKDREEIMQYTGTHKDVVVIGVDPQLDRLMVASDLAITKGTYGTGKELAALGIPSISLSHGKNFIDDFFSRSIESNTFLWVEETDPLALAKCIKTNLELGLRAADIQALNGEGAASLAACLGQTLAQSRALRSAGQ